MFCDYSKLVTLYKIGEVHFRLLGTNGFHVKAKNERFMHLSMLSLRVGGLATHGVSTVRSVPKVVILIVQDIPRVGNLTWPSSWLMKRAWKSTCNVIIALLLCAARSEGYYFGHLYSPQPKPKPKPKLLILLANYVIPEVGNLTHFFRKCQNPHPMSVPPPPPGA